MYVVNFAGTRDPRARKVLLAAMELAVDTVEAFSNSPPQWYALILH